MPSLHKKMSQNTNLLEDLRIECRKQIIQYPPKKSIKKEIISIAKKAAITLYTGKQHMTDRFFWPNALLANALEISHKRYNDIKDLEALVKYYNKWIEKGAKFNALDNAMNAYALLYLNEICPQENYEKTIEKAISYIVSHPKDKAGSLPYRNDDSNNILIDSLGMICPLLCRYGDSRQNVEAVDIASQQLNNFFEFGFDSKTNLPYHGYNTDKKIKLGIIGWGRGVGWLMIGLVVHQLNCFKGN